MNLQMINTTKPVFLNANKKTTTPKTTIIAAATAETIKEHLQGCAYRGIPGRNPPAFPTTTAPSKENTEMSETNHSIISMQPNNTIISIFVS